MRRMREFVHTFRVARRAVQRTMHGTRIPIGIDGDAIRPVTLHAGRSLTDVLGQRTGNRQDTEEKKRSDDRSFHGRSSNLNCPDHRHPKFQAFLHVRDERVRLCRRARVFISMAASHLA